MIEKAGDLAGLLRPLNAGDVLFIDEIPPASATIEEYLYPAMEDYKLDIIIDQGPSARSVRLNCEVHAHRRDDARGMIRRALRSRFGMTSRLDFYIAEDLQKIIRSEAGLLNVERRSGALEIAGRAAARGIANICCAGCAILRKFARTKKSPRDRR